MRAACSETSSIIAPAKAPNSLCCQGGHLLPHTQEGSYLINGLISTAAVQQEHTQVFWHKQCSEAHRGAVSTTAGKGCAQTLVLAEHPSDSQCAVDVKAHRLEVQQQQQQQHPGRRRVVGAQCQHAGCDKLAPQRPAWQFERLTSAVRHCSSTSGEGSSLAAAEGGRVSARWQLLWCPPAVRARNSTPLRGSTCRDTHTRLCASPGEGLACCWLAAGAVIVVLLLWLPPWRAQTTGWRGSPGRSLPAVRLTLAAAAAGAESARG